MKIKTLMDFLNDSNESGDTRETGTGSADYRTSDDEKVVYIENPGFETVSDQMEGKELLQGGTHWTDQSMGELLVAEGKLTSVDVDRIIDHQREKGLYFGEAAVDLKLVSQDDILQALSRQFGYTYGQGDDTLSKEKVMASSPFGGLAEEFRSIRGQLLSNWLTPHQKTLAIVSPGSKEGRSYVAANLAMAFSQMGRSTMLVDADLRSPRQHEIFDVKSRVGLSMLLAGRVRMEDLDTLPDTVSTFQYLSVLGCGAVPPNPAEILGNGRFSSILRQLKKYFDVIIIDTPPATYKADVMSIASVAGSALLVARSGHSRTDDTKSLVSLLGQVETKVVGAVLNQY
ncbi:MAG TPA: polysaccharide biosynthesis tyrosine autokinase [Gammaproteobacteria bacterium]|nr:polysaccharide biosynthesis tyrosine autokinase [Gammaproteobacteria bacterium]